MGNIRELISRHRGLQVVLIIVGLGLIFGYFNLFTSVGIKFEGTFLKREKTQVGFLYEGQTMDGAISVNVSKIKRHNSETLVEFALPNNLEQSFTTQYARNNTQFDIKSLKDEAGTLLFKGTFMPEENLLLTESEGLYVEQPTLSIEGDEIFNEDYRVSLASVLAFATDQSTIRGHYELFIIGLILTVGGVLEYLYPTFFFKLRYKFTVQDPEPTDFYMICQRGGVFLSLVLGPLLLWAALYN